MRSRHRRIRGRIVPGFRAAAATAMLAAAALAATIPAGALQQEQEPAQVAGKWLLTMHGSEITMMDFYVDFEQEGGAVKGVLEGFMGEQRVEGKVDGNRLEFAATVESPEGAYAIVFTAVVEENKTMSGSIVAGEGQFSARFSGERREQS